MRRTTLALAASLIALGAHAQKAGPNGGVVMMAGHHPIEFVAAGKEIVFHLSDEDGTPLRTPGATGRASFQQDGRTITVTLAPTGPDRLVGAVEAPLASGTKLVLSAKIHGHAVQVRFTAK